MQRRQFITGVVATTVGSAALFAHWQETSTPISPKDIPVVPEVIDSTKLRFDNAGIDMVGNEKELLEFIRSMTPGTLVADIVEASVFHMVHEKWRSFSRAFQDQFATLLMQAIKHAKPLNIEGDIPPIAWISISISSSNTRMFTVKFGKDRLVLSNGEKLESINIGYTYEGDVIIDSDTAQALEKKGIRYNKEERILHLEQPYFVINYGGGKASPEVLEAYKLNTPLSRISLKDIIEFRFSRNQTLKWDFMFLTFRGNDENTVLRAPLKGDLIDA